jgi:adiponectin receptor
VIPAVHYSVQEGWIKALNLASLGWLILMGLLYIIGTMFYALRIPERFFPGKFDIWVRILNLYLTADLAPSTVGLITNFWLTL